MSRPPCGHAREGDAAIHLTNHSLSPLTDVNDPLLNTLSVTTPRWLQLSTLDFGLHVEHHLFPAMSSRQAPQVREILIARWPERYQSMPLWRALGRLVNTARVYKGATTLCDPRTGREWPTLGPRSIAPSGTLRECLPPAAQDPNPVLAPVG